MHGKMIAMDGEKNDKTGIKIFITLLGREHSESSEMGSYGDSRASKTFTRNIIVRHTGILSFANKETLNGQLKLIGEGNLANLRDDYPDTIFIDEKDPLQTSLPRTQELRGIPSLSLEGRLRDRTYPTGGTHGGMRPLRPYHGGEVADNHENQLPHTDKRWTHAILSDGFQMEQATPNP